MRGPFERAARSITAADDLRKFAKAIDLTHFVGHPHEFAEATIAISHINAAAARFEQAAKEAYREGERQEVGRI